MRIRELTYNDAGVLRSLRLEALQSDPGAFGETIEEAEALTERDWESRLKGELVPGRKTTLVVEDEGMPIAMCFVGLRDEDPSTGYFAGMYVSPAVRRGGIGSTLLNAAEEWIRQCGGLRIKTGVAAPNDAAINFYKNLGYAISGDLKKLRERSDIPVHTIEKHIKT